MELNMAMLFEAKPDAKIGIRPIDPDRIDGEVAESLKAARESSIRVERGQLITEEILGLVVGV
jgi:hypothetical protein